MKLVVPNSTKDDPLATNVVPENKTDTIASDSIKRFMKTFYVLGMIAEAILILSYFTKLVSEEIVSLSTFVSLFFGIAGTFFFPAVMLDLWSKAVHVSEITNEYLKLIADKLINDDDDLIEVPRKANGGKEN